jgi:CDGSH-type Zn-finger protein
MADVTIKVRDNGPYRISGPIVVMDAEGNPYEWREETVVLCRCGHSLNKPFCDGTHKAIGFESATRAGADPAAG